MPTPAAPADDLRRAPIDELLTEVEVARYLAIDAQTLRAARSRRVGGFAGLPYTRVGSRIRYRARDVQAWIDAQEVPGAG